jgi:IS30 family transposase
MNKYTQLTQQQRYIIQDLFNLEKTQTYIAIELGVNRSTICRELHRNKNLKSLYKAKGAQLSTVDRRFAANEGYQKIKNKLKEIVVEKLNIGWSPEQITGRLKLEDSIHKISHESIYTWIYNKEPTYKLKLRRQGRRQRRGNKKKKRQWVGKEARKLIDERPLVCDERNEIGHWERDLVEGVKSHSSLLVIVDRTSRLSILNKVSTHHADHVNKKTHEGLKEDDHPVFSMTNDNGIEFGQW